MKKPLYLLASLLFLVTSCAGDEGYPVEEDFNARVEETTIDASELVPEVRYESYRIYRNRAAETHFAPYNSEQFRLEKLLRCSVDNKNKRVTTTIPFKFEAFDLYRLNVGDALPRYEVTGYSFANKPADEVFRELLAEAGIRVVGTDKIYPEISGSDIKGELSSILDSIAEAADIYYSYNAQRQTVFLKRNDLLAFQVPNRDLVLPVLDALRGAAIQDISIDWGDNILMFYADRLMERRVERLIEFFDKEPQLAVYNVTVYQVEPKMPGAAIDWTAVVGAYGTNSVKMAEPGTIGQVLVTNHTVNHNTLMGLLSSQANVFQVAQGEFSVPNKWRARFDIWNCGNLNISENRLSILTQAEIKGKRIHADLGIDTKKGEISSFKTINRLDENILMFNIPSNSLGYHEYGETIVLLSPKIVDVIKEK